MYSNATLKEIFTTIQFNINSNILKNLKLDTFGEKLRCLRLQRNLNQREFAKLLNRSFTSICNWEQGNRIPKPETIREIAETLNVDYTYFKDSNFKLSVFQINYKKDSILNKGY